MPAVKIPAQRDHWLGFDLREVMDAIGVQKDLTWRLLGALLACDDAVGVDRWQAVAYDSRVSEGTTLTWGDMEELAAACRRVVEGTFTGFQGNDAVVQMRAVGTGYWVVWARRSSVLENIRFTFMGVEDFDERTPHR